jgi:hypothetical protein
MDAEKPRGDEMILDVRSLVDWMKDVVGRGRVSGGGPLGTPSHDLDEAPPGLDQESNRGVSGGGMVGPDDLPEQHKAERSRSRP